MIVTQFDLDNLSKNCQRIIDLISYMKLEKDFDKLFMSRSDYEKSIKARELTPEDFYNFRLFDVETHISYHSKQQTYIIVLKGSYSNVLDNYKQNTRSKTSFYISNSLEETIEVWKDVVFDVLNQKVLSNGLF